MSIPYHPAQTPLRPRSDPAHTPLRPRSHLAQVPFFHVKVVTRPPRRRQHPPNHQPSTNFDDHGIRARRRLAPQLWSPLTIARWSLEEYITADPQRELEVRRWCIGDVVRHHRNASCAGGGCFVVMEREVSSRTIGIAPRMNEFDRIKLIVNLQIVKTSLQMANPTYLSFFAFR
jgi:hypothetical protein